MITKIIGQLVLSETSKQKAVHQALANLAPISLRL
jgi:hypothetical protein